MRKERVEPILNNAEMEREEAERKLLLRPIGDTLKRRQDKREERAIRTHDVMYWSED